MAATRRSSDEQLRELDERYAWLVNAAIAEGRDDLVARYADRHLEEAMTLMREATPAG